MPRNVTEGGLPSSLHPTTPAVEGFGCDQTVEMCQKCFLFGLGSQIMTDPDFRRTVIIKQWKNPNGLSVAFHGGM